MTGPRTPPDKIPVAELLEEYRRVVLATHDMTSALVGLADSLDECAADTSAELKALREDVKALADRRPVIDALKALADVARAVLETKAGKAIAVSAAVGALVSFLSAIGLSPEVIGGILRAIAGGVT